MILMEMQRPGMKIPPVSVSKREVISKGLFPHFINVARDVGAMQNPATLARQ